MKSLHVGMNVVYLFFIPRLALSPDNLLGVTQSDPSVPDSSGVFVAGKQLWILALIAVVNEFK